jgi:hypothetical protein
MAEPKFDENHHRYHTPANPLESCENCQYLNWVECDQWILVVDPKGDDPRVSGPYHSHSAGEDNAKNLVFGTPYLVLKLEEL